MSGNVVVCNIDENLIEELKKFRFSKTKTGCAIIMKVDKARQMIMEEERLEDCTAEELSDSLPTHQPRFAVFSFCHEHADGRVSYPMVFIFCSPLGVPTDLAMIYAGSKNNLVRQAGMTKLLEVREPEEITEEWIKQQLKLT